MHILQQKLLKLSQQMDLSKLGLRQIGKLVGESHPQKIKHHLEQLEKNGFIHRDKKTGVIKLNKQGKLKDANLFSLPIVGMANCGEATMLAVENIEGYLRVSCNMLKSRSPQGLFIVKAIGDSLNRAIGVKGGPIESGDFVVVDGNNRNPRNGDYVLSVIDEMANLKRFYQDKITGEIALVSESTLNIEPIYIHPRDFREYMVNGVVVRVIKKTKF